MKKTVCIIGLGYIGLPTAAVFASKGVNVVAVDINERVVESLKKGEIIIEEPLLPELVKKVVADGFIEASTTPKEADAYIIAVPTPINEDKTSDMTYVRKATESILKFLKKGDIVILESTSPPKTITNLIAPIIEGAGFTVGEDIFLAYSPERVLPGKILEELVENNRIIGGYNEKSAEKVKELYSVFVKGDIITTDSTTAETCKLMENTFRDVNIALANELAKICEDMNINVWDVIKFSNMHPRVNIHQPGPGVGGHCIAVDPWFMVEATPSLSKIIKLSRETNDSMPLFVADKIKSILDLTDGKKVSILGITYKPDVDDMRESPIMELIEILRERNTDVSIYDPHVENFKDNSASLEDCVENSDLIVLAVNHKEFASLDFSNISKIVNSNNKNVLDTRNFWDRDEIVKAGFNYNLLGSSR